MAPRNMTPPSSRAGISIFFAATFAAGLIAGAACQKSDPGKTKDEPEDDVDAAVMKKDAGSKDRVNLSPDMGPEQPDMKVQSPDAPAADGAPAGTDGPRGDASPDGYIL